LITAIAQSMVGHIGRLVGAKAWFTIAPFRWSHFIEPMKSAMVESRPLGWWAHIKSKHSLPV
jgi:cell division protein FtsX